MTSRRRAKEGFDLPPSLPSSPPLPPPPLRCFGRGRQQTRKKKTGTEPEQNRRPLLSVSPPPPVARHLSRGKTTRNQDASFGVVAFLLLSPAAAPPPPHVSLKSTPRGGAIGSKQARKKEGGERERSPRLRLPRASSRASPAGAPALPSQRAGWLRGAP